ncbi:hypothetical protein BDV96DRAFT_650113 [Lophiotrema nucula]|uniref:Uncharacterized protein n=1 Tax=Lophiotrema nucula TaxID=690887 RepID=A0A6A5YYA1_9PLEO|nr:hypothetical protein BDV96DRAFT_650113 [Lophiotrema nucula]
MSDLLMFDTDIARPTRASQSAVTDAPPNGPPRDNFEVRVPLPDKTLFYLTATSPHTDTFEVHGPVRQFRTFRDKVEQIVAVSPAATKKLEDLEEDKPDVFIGGFRTFVVELGNDDYTKLEVIREINPKVYEHLPAPVYLVTSHGPMIHDLGGTVQTLQSGRRLGYAATSHLVSSFTDFDVAKQHATQAMDIMLQKEINKGGGIGMIRTDVDDNKSPSMGNWMSVAMGGGKVWEVKVTVVKEVNKGKTNTFNTDI